MRVVGKDEGGWNPAELAFVQLSCKALLLLLLRLPRTGYEVQQGVFAGKKGGIELRAHSAKLILYYSTPLIITTINNSTNNHHVTPQHH